MKRRRITQRAFLNVRTSIAVLLCAVAVCWVLSATVLAFFRPEAATKVQTLSFSERVAYQRAIEDVYWRHRIWPKERPDPKPSLDAVMSQAQLEKKVTDYLRKSQALEDYSQRLSAEQLQAEIDRMASHTKQPEVLRELFEALGNDPFVIAECLARPALAERDLTTIAPRKESLNLSPTRVEGQIGKIPGASARFTVPTIPNGVECVADTWRATSIQPEGRHYHTAVWTGSEMIVWGGSVGSELNTDRKYNPSVASLPMLTPEPTATTTPIPYVNTGARYSPATDSWTATNPNAPVARVSHTAVWTGTEMIVWGGYDGLPPTGYTNTGGRYNPTSDTWSATSFTNAPTARSHHTAVWTGSEMIVWSGFDIPEINANSGGRYNPITNSWTATSMTNVPDSRQYHTAVWTGSEMIVWGGTQNLGITKLNTGGRYNPSTNSWIATTVTNAPTPRFYHTGVWSGNEMIVWGGLDQNDFELHTGGNYNPGTDSWTATSLTNPPSSRALHTAIWTGSEMIVWGGSSYLNSGGRYSSSTDSWTATSMTNVPDGRVYHTAVWTGSEMIVWGGQGGSGNLNTGGRYCAQFAPATPTPTPTATAMPTSTPSPAARSTPVPRLRPTPVPRP